MIMANTFPEDHNNNLEWVDNTILFYATPRHATPRHATTPRHTMSLYTVSL